MKRAGGSVPPHLQGGIGGGGFASLATFELCLDIRDFMLGMHLYDTLTVFLLMILCNGFDFGKHSFMMFKNFLPTLVDTFREKGGLNHVIFLGLFFGLTLLSMMVWGFADFQQDKLNW